MARGFYREVVENLQGNGYYRKSGGKGSHEKWASEEEGKPTVTVPFNLYSRFTANGIMKDAGIAKRF